MPPKIKIEVCRRAMNPGHFHACLKGNEGIWADGETTNDAIGDLIRYHSEIFGIEIEYPEGESR